MLALTECLSNCIYLHAGLQGVSNRLQRSPCHAVRSTPDCASCCTQLKIPAVSIFVCPRPVLSATTPMEVASATERRRSPHMVGCR